MISKNDLQSILNCIKNDINHEKILNWFLKNGEEIINEIFILRENTEKTKLYDIVLNEEYINNGAMD